MPKAPPVRPLLQPHPLAQEESRFETQTSGTRGLRLSKPCNPWRYKSPKSTFFFFFLTSLWVQGEAPLDEPAPVHGPHRGGVSCIPATLIMRRRRSPDGRGRLWADHAREGQGGRLSSSPCWPSTPPWPTLSTSPTSSSPSTPAPCTLPGTLILGTGPVQYRRVLCNA